jgi:hypothetical protein
MNEASLHPDTPVMVEWWSHRWIPSVHHATITTYRQAMAWHLAGAKMACFELEDGLYQELTGHKLP